jgi:hypothetical protein
MRKYFETLELDESASIEEVERAYMELLEAWRPENYQNLPRYRRKAEGKLKEINEAYERLKSYLATRAQSEALPRQTEPDLQSVDAGPEPQPPADPSLEPEPAIAPERPVDSPPWEPEYPTQPDEVISRPRIQKTVQKSLIFGFVAIIAVLGVLLIYRVSNRQQPTEPQTQMTEKAQPTAASPLKPAAAARPEKAPAQKVRTEAESAPPHRAARAGVQKQASPPAAAPPYQIDYQKALSEQVLNPYNQNRTRVRRIQKSLIASGYETGPIDGIIGPVTSAALQKFAADHQLGHDTLFAPDLAAAAVLYAEVAAEHPAWHQIIASDDFASWLDSQTYYATDRIQTLKNSATARQVNDIIALYKLEHHMQPD